MLTLVILVDLVGLAYQVFMKEWKKLCPIVLSALNGYNFYQLHTICFFSEIK